MDVSRIPGFATSKPSPCATASPPMVKAPQILLYFGFLEGFPQPAENFPKFFERAPNSPVKPTEDRTQVRVFM
jgi:hypothetical protein